MNFKNTLVLFGVLLSLLWIFGVVVEVRKATVDEGFLFPDIHNNLNLKIETVELERDGKNYVFTRAEDKGWILTPPESKGREVWRIQESKIEELIKQVQEARRNQEADIISGLTASDIKEGTFKEDRPPTTKVILKEKGVGKQYELYVGPKSDINVFVVSSERPHRIAAIKASALSSLLVPDLREFRSRDLLKVNSQAAQSLTITKKEGDKKLTVTRTGEGLWRFAQPASFGMADFAGSTLAPKNKLFGEKEKDKDQERPGVKGLLDELGKLRVESVKDFEPLNKSSFADFGLAEGKETLRIEVASEEGLDKKATVKEVLLVGTSVGDKDNKKYFVRLEKDKYVAKVNAKDLEPFFNVVDDPKSLRSLDLAFFELMDPDAVDIKAGPKAKETVQMRKVAATLWKMYVGDQSYKASSVTVDGEKGSLAALRGKGEIKEFADAANEEEAKKLDSKFGFDTPTAEVAIYINGLEEGKDAKKDKKDKTQKGKAKEDDTGAKEPELKEGAKPAVRLIFGNRDADKVHVKRILIQDNKEDVSRVEVPISILDKVNPPQGTLAFLEKELPPLDTTDAVKIELKHGPEEFVLERKKEGKGKEAKDVWKRIAPKDLPGQGTDEANVAKVLDTLRGLKVVSWVQKVGAKEELPEKVGLKNPDLVVKVTFQSEPAEVEKPAKEKKDKKAKDEKGKDDKAKDEKGKKEEVRVYQFGSSGKAGKDKGVYALVSGRDLVFLAPAETVTALREVELRDRTVFKLEGGKLVDADKVRDLKINWKLPKGFVVNLQLERKAAGDDWKVVKLEGFDKSQFKLEGPKATNFVRAVANLKVLRYVSFKGAAKSEHKLGDDQAQLKIILKMEDGKEQTLTVGDQNEAKTGFYARAGTLPEVIFLVDKDPFEALLKGVSYFNAEE